LLKDLCAVQKKKPKPRNQTESKDVKKTADKSKGKRELQIVNFQSRFTPSGPDVKDCSHFFNFWLAASNETYRIKAKSQAERKKHLKQLMAAKEKVWPLLFDILGDKISIEEGAAKFRKLVPDQKLARELFDIWEKAVKATPEQVEVQGKDIERREKELAKSEKIFNAENAIVRGLETLVEATHEGDLKAAKALANSAIALAVQLSIAERKYLKTFKALARKEAMWPVLASDVMGWEKKAARHIKQLELGDDAQMFKMRFNNPRGADDNLPARVWAKAAVRTIEDTQFRIIASGAVIRKLGTKPFADFLSRKGFGIGEHTCWMRDVTGLKPLSQKSLTEWKRVIRKIVRAEMRDFHLHEDWKAHRNSAERSGRNSKGEIQNAILDDICSALKRLVPQSALPKSAC
jgi:hypothetical protein